MEKELPLGFGMELAQNSLAMQHFCNMTEEQQKTVLSKAKGVSTRQEMNSIVASLAKE